MIFNSQNNFEFFEGALNDTFQSIMNNEYRGENSTFLNVMSSKYYRDRFVTIICDLMNTSFSAESLDNIITEENEKIDEFRKMFYGSDKVSSSEENYNYMKTAALEREKEIRADFKRYFGLEEQYYLNLKVPEGAMVSWNNMHIYENEEYSNDYYKGVDFEIEAVANPGYKFDYWVVNGNQYEGNTLMIDNDLIENNTIVISPVVSKIESSCIVVNSISAKGDYDWIELSNYGETQIYLGDYYLTDEESNLKKYNLPDVYLDMDSSVIIHCKNNYEALGDYVCNFNLSAGEKLILSDNDGIVDNVYIPIMSSNEVYGRYKRSNNWLFVKR